MAYFPNVSAVSRRLSGGNQSKTQQYEQYGRLCKTGSWSKFTHDHGDCVSAFKAARLFVPDRVIELAPDAHAIDSLAVFSFLNYPTLLSELKTEFSLYGV